MAVEFLLIDQGATTRVQFDSDGGGTPSYAQVVKLGNPVDGGSGIAPGDATDGYLFQSAKLIPGTGATNLGKAIDSIAGATDTGVGALMVRTDAPATITPASGDWAAPRLSKRGSQWIEPADNTASGNLTSTTSVTLSDLQGASTVAFDLRGTFVATLQFEASIDGTNFFAIQSLPTTPGALVTSATAVGSWQADVAGYAQVRVRCSAFTSGTVNVTIRASVGVGLLGLDSPLPTGANVIGAVTQSGTWTADTELPAAAAMSDTISRTLSTPQVGALLMYDDASNYVRAKGDVTGGAWVQGPAATDLPVAGKPLLTGARASAASPTDMSADNDIIPITVDRSGILYSRPFDHVVSSVTPTVSTTPAYSAQDQVGGVMTFTNAARKAGGIGEIYAATIRFAALSGLAATNQLVIHLFHNRTTAPTITSSDNGALQITDANLVAGEFMGTLIMSYDFPAIGAAEMGGLIGFTDNFTMYRQFAKPWLFKCGSSVSSIYGVCSYSTGSTLQFAGTTDMTVTLFIKQY